MSAIMEEALVQDRPGLLTKFVGLFARERAIVEEEEETEFALPETPATAARPAFRYTVTVRRHIASFEDALAAANGLKRGEQQILNLCSADLVTRQKIVDFICGVNFAQEGTWEELGENVYLVAPAHAFVEVPPAGGRATAR